MLYQKGTVDGIPKTPKSMIETKKPAHNKPALVPFLQTHLDAEKKHLTQKEQKAQEIADKLAEAKAAKAKTDQEGGDVKLAQDIANGQVANKAREEARVKVALHKKQQKVDANKPFIPHVDPKHPSAYVHLKKATMLDEDNNPLAHAVNLALQSPVINSAKLKHNKGKPAAAAAYQDDNDHSSVSGAAGGHDVQQIPQAPGGGPDGLHLDDAALAGALQAQEFGG